VVAAVAAYLSWGLFPIYFKAVATVPALQVLAHRVIWSMAFLVAIVTVRRRWRALLGELRGRRLAVYGATTVLISANWLLFIWAVTSGHVLESSLGYFVNPLVSVLLGAVFLHERLSPRQVVAVALAAAGVLALILRLGAVPWISLLLAATFALYGLLRKKSGIDPILGLLVETVIVTPVAVAYLGLLSAGGHRAFGPDIATSALLLCSGVITPLPLIWFAVAVRSLRLATVGILQYLAPSCQFVLAVALYREPFTRAHALAFACIWVSLGLYTWDALRSRPAMAAEPLALD
jgi:chloramphenicol-sensitive protein RarD